MLFLTEVEPASRLSFFSVAEVWREWEIYSCVERHGDHLWMVELYHPEDDVCVNLYCDYCPAGVDDIYIDGIDLVYGQLGSVNIEAGSHDSENPLLPFSLPVKVELEVEKYFNPLDMIYPEYDVYINLSLRS